MTSCGSSISPSQVNDTLPSLTQATYYNQVNAAEAQNSGKCKLLTKSRNYVAPIGFTVKNDLKNGARGIDEWVQLDGGNAYVLTNFKWVTVDHQGSTQLHIDFNTMVCE
ncbi:hypothetical protein [Neotamlana laminarinivorans]|uniref:Uncharacterized protein n=1 Tax=Neotamlana laminarinivorans TaxID=2883124 RepID=A0A9X1I2F0_9FLAO|nr:hypothetical protein [Tamlana laminarinivorans]MCB4800131.1 hypothetical protein [Tamlana laminarinivorans]